MALPADDGCALIAHAMAQEEDEKIFARWIPQAQMFVSFDDFKSGLAPAPQKPEQEVLDDAEAILNAMHKEMSKKNGSF